MSKAKNNKASIIERLKKSQESEDFNISLAADSIKTLTTGMDVLKIDIERVFNAPDEWNFYTPLNDTKMFELVDSIAENGLLNPIIVWENDDGNYMILSGHNRVRAYNMLYSSTNDNKYKKIHAYIKKKKEISELEAKNIIVDTNFVQRQLSTYEKTKSIVYKYKSMGRKKRNSSGKDTAEIIADKYKMSRRQVFNYYKLRELIAPFMNMIDSGLIPLRCGIKLASLSTEFQNELYENHKDKLDAKKLMELDIKQSKEKIIQQLEFKKPEYISFSVKIPAKFQNEFEVYVNEWKEKMQLKI